MHNFQELKIWQKAMDMATVVYEKTASLPNDERFGLMSQMRRAAVSVSSNIAEGAGRNSDKDFNRFLSFAQGSLGELYTQTLIAKRINFISEEDTSQLTNLLDELMRMNNALQSKLKARYLNEPEATYETQPNNHHHKPAQESPEI